MPAKKAMLILLLAAGMPLAQAHEGHEGQGQAGGKPGKSASGKQARQDAPRFCMKNREGKTHCIPFGPH